MSRFISSDEKDQHAERARVCVTCNGFDPVSGVRRRETVGLVCERCGWDYGEDGEPEEWLAGLPACEGWVCQSCGADNFIPAGFVRVGRGVDGGSAGVA